MRESRATYVHNTQRPGPVLLDWCTGNRERRFEDNSYAADKDELENVQENEYAADDYFICYIYPSQGCRNR